MSCARVSEWEFAVFMRKNVRGTRADVLFSNERRDRGTRTRERNTVVTGFGRRTGRQRERERAREKESEQEKGEKEKERTLE